MIKQRDAFIGPCCALENSGRMTLFYAVRNPCTRESVRSAIQWCYFKYMVFISVSIIVYVWTGFNLNDIDFTLKAVFKIQSFLSQLFGRVDSSTA